MFYTFSEREYKQLKKETQDSSKYRRVKQEAKHYMNMNGCLKHSTNFCNGCPIGEISPLFLSDDGNNCLADINMEYKKESKEATCPDNSK